MEANALHDLTAAYALDALGAHEEREYEAHLARCEPCRSELARLTETATSLAYGIEAPEPPARLRESILGHVRAERPNVVPLRPRWALPAAVTAVAAVAATIALALWASSLSNKVDRVQAARDRQERVAAILGSDAARPIRIGNLGKLVVTPGGAAALVLNRLAPAGHGRIYEAWVAENGSPKPAGTFQSGGNLTAVPLDRPVRSGARVLVTKERHRVETPTQAPLITVTS
jgi:anti-sigma factor RsiW